MLISGLSSGLNERDGRVVVNRFGVQRLEDADAVGNLRGLRKQFAEPLATLPMLGERKSGRRDGETFLFGCHPRQSLALSNGVGKVGGMVFVELGLVIKEVEL